MDVQHEELIILDFDHTVFNTTLLVDRLKERFEEKFGILPDEFEHQRDALKSCCEVVDVDQFVERLNHDDKQGMHDEIVETIKEVAPKAIHGDAIDFIRRHQEIFDVMLLTHGDTELQETKIDSAGLMDVPYVIVKDDKSDTIATIIDRYKRIHFIDDKPENLESVHERFPDVEIYFMKRPDDMPYGGESLQCACADHEIQDLTFTIAPAA